MNVFVRFAFVLATLHGYLALGASAIAQMSKADKELTAGILNIVAAGVKAATPPPPDVHMAPSMGPNSSGYINNQSSFTKPPQNYPQHWSQYPQNYQPQYVYPSNPHYHESGRVYMNPSTNHSSTAVHSQSYSTTSPTSAPKISEYKKTKPSFICCPDDQQNSFSYQLVSNKTGKVHEYSISSGETQEITEPSRWKIRFKPSGSSSTKTYQIDPDTTYQALQSGGGIWEVYAE